MTGFTWDPAKELANIRKHGISFAQAARAFDDPDRKVFEDSTHDWHESRLFCIGKVDGRIMTVRFVVREDIIRIYGAGYWRKGKEYYEEKENK